VIPDWLQETREYPARPDRNAFIEKSILSMLGLLSRMRPPRTTAGKRGRINARVGLASAVLLILLLSLARDVLFVAYAGALLLAILSVQRGEVILRILTTSLPLAMLTALVMLPSALWGNPASLTMIPLKVFLSVVALRLLVENEPWESILDALRVFFLPRLFILVLDITTRYLVLLGEHSLAMLWALRLRSVGHNSRKAASLAGIVGALFLKSRQMAEETYAAMECRCFTGRYPGGRARRTSVTDLAALGLDALTVVLFFAVRAA
jgi:cobalt/nickel transport system permease protein